MKTIQIEIPEGKKAEWVNGVLRLVDDMPIARAHKFKVGDKMIYPLFSKDKILTIKELVSVDGCPCYNLISDDNIWLRCKEGDIHPYVLQDITERIKTFEDAVKWCDKNKPQLVDQWQDYLNKEDDDVEAYLKLRIISAALNEGWEPTIGKLDNRYFTLFKTDSNWSESTKLELLYVGESSKLCFKSKDLALYAATQFKDIYLDFYGCKEGDRK